tara:strand:- start:460 stop:1029 length:570 start_codon:yes stop_codon:yes gene_type:complete
MKVDLIIPENWEDITIGTYQNYISIQESNINDKNKIIKSLALLCNTTESIIKKIAYSDLKDIMSIVKGLVDKEPNKKDFKKTFLFNGQEYGFLPNLSRLSTGEYIDLENYCKNSVDNLHVIMSILYRPITFQRGDRYAIEDYDPDQFKEVLFKDCPMDIALNSLGFFLTLGEKLAKISHNYLKKMKKKK